MVWVRDPAYPFWTMSTRGARGRRIIRAMYKQPEPMCGLDVLSVPRFPAVINGKGLGNREEGLGMRVQGSGFRTRPSTLEPSPSSLSPRPYRWHFLRAQGDDPLATNVVGCALPSDYGIAEAVEYA